MINAFLMSVYNSSSVPVQLPASAGEIVADFAGYTPYAPTAQETLFLNAFYNGLDDYQRFCRALQASLCVGASVSASNLLAVDPRVTYTYRQAAEHIANSGITGLQVAVDAGLAAADLRRLLSDTDYIAWDARVSPIDKIGLLISHFGVRAWA